MHYDQELAAALTAARRAGDLLCQEYNLFQAIPDAPASITTNADHLSQETILQSLQHAFPHDAYCAEENTDGLVAAARGGARMWIIDPIDGTRGFARKNGEFSVMIAFLDEREIAVGVVLEPAKARVTYASRGGGCWRQDGHAESPVRCHVTTATQVSAATLTQSHSKNPKQPSKPVTALGPKRVVESYSAGIKLALVARGEADVYVNTYEAFSDWDICAGHILVAEAGGRVTGLQGQTLAYTGQAGMQRQGLLATNGHLHEPCVERLAQGIQNAAKSEL